ncbi:MAG: UDP-N-acetylglucosamine 1-carboxyvinyltransferase [Candidatus Uhrbacteria bacterium]|nr:UDP-N-acetylglucosamine 1-carboxyvinyltransferase [Candidatus Uhrbacteria bacterium]
MKFVITGGKKLRGSIAVGGAKNAVLPILAATLLTDEKCVIHNVPVIRDVDMMLDLLTSIGRTIVRDGDHTVTVSSERGVSLPHTLDPKLVKSFRASFLVLGPLLARNARIRITEPGGCSIGNRPVDDHFHGLKRMGVKVSRSNGVYTLSHHGLEAKTITLVAPSVTATENLVMAAVLTKGTTIIKDAAAEPHVQDLCFFLESMGATIDGIGTSTLIIRGVKKLHGTTHSVIPDPIGAMSYIMLGLATKSRITITGIRPDHLDVPLETLLAAGARFDIDKDSITLRTSGLLAEMKVQTRPYPGIPTDIQALFGVLATQAQGTSLIHETIFDGRFAYISELARMGANAVVCDPHRAMITGPTPLYGQEIRSSDLRAGMAMIVAALIARGQTVIHDAHIIERGYETIVERLSAIGAHIRREN